ncbi:MAG TPA: 50S ribosomal protein L24 [Acidimicrobiales bacterium]|nr:50S ribosomal protein L24 [Acidimicrobiales bacterium]
MKLRKGDTVMVLSGKQRGERGTVMRLMPKEGRAIVEGVNLVKRHQRQTQTRVKGGIIDKEMPMPLSNLAIICKKDGPTRVGYEYRDDGTKVRVCRKCGEAL